MKKWIKIDKSLFAGKLYRYKLQMKPNNNPENIILNLTFLVENKLNQTKKPYPQTKTQNIEF